MGIFSWMDCVNPDTSIKFDQYKKVYVLVPERYHNILGTHIVESHYRGYGNFGGYNIFDIIAEFNKEYLSEELLKAAPKLDDFDGLYSYEKEALKEKGLSDEEINKKDLEMQKRYFNAAMNYRNDLIACMNDYKSGMNADELDDKYGDSWKVDIGIAIADSDELNAKLPYPIKITYNADAVYENCKPSLKDPAQGY